MRATDDAHGTAFTIRRLGPDDASNFHALRLEGFSRHPLEFRFAPEDELSLPFARVEARLASEFVVGGLASDGTLAATGGLTIFPGAKLRHKALLWGMYVRDSARGRGLGDAIVSGLLEHARDHGVEVVQLTVMADNARARRLYERCGFTTYGVEPRAVKVTDGERVIYLDEALMAVYLVPPFGQRSR